MTTTTMTKRLLLVLGFLCALPLTARAQNDERKSPLADAPAIRKRVELRAKRFEIGAGVGASLGDDFYHSTLLGLRASFHFNDWFAIGGVLGQNVTPNFKTGLTDKLLDTLDKSYPAGSPVRQPTSTDALKAMNKVGQIAALQVEITPFTGKYALFNRLFSHYDFYVFGGPGFINFTSDSPSCSSAQVLTCATVGTKIGANFGAGVHSFINDFLTLNLELRDIFLKNNDAGRDTIGDAVNGMNQPLVGPDSQKWGSNYFLSLSATFFLPGKADVSE